MYALYTEGNLRHQDGILGRPENPFDFEVDMMRSMLQKIMEVQNYLQMQSLKGKKLAHRTLDSQEIAALPY